MTDSLGNAAVLVERRAHIMIVTLNRPEVRNAVNLDVHVGVGRALAAADRDPDIRAIILTGKGDVFCAGLDLKALSRGDALKPTDPVELAWGFAGVIEHAIGTPLIAAVNGSALGGGTELALAADLVVASDTARFGLPEVKRGVIAGAGGAIRLVNQIPRKLAMEMLLTGEPIDAQTALDHGLINRVVPPDRLMDETIALAERITVNAPLSVQASKRIALAIVDGAFSTETDAWLRNRAEATIVMQSNDSREGPRAFAEKTNARLGRTLTMTDPARIPVIVGVGQINDRPTDLSAGLNSLDLMEQALRLADADAGGGWLADLDTLAVVDQISCPELGRVAVPLAVRLGAQPRLCMQTPLSTGDSPILLLNEAANRIGAGEISISAIVGGDALRTASRRAAAREATSVADQNASRKAAASRAGGYRTRYGLVAAVEVYPLYENGGRAAYGQSLAEGQRESAEIWSRFSQVAAENPGAWIREPQDVEAILTPSVSNRPIAFPYLKLMVANNAVNQGAGFIVTSLAEARRRGVAEDRIIHVGMGAAAHESTDPLERDRYDRTTSMGVSLRRALDLNGVTADQLDHVELYSCFPCVPKMARRVLGWPVDRPATVSGGLTFGGGPIGNYMSHAVAAMVEKLRHEGRLGLLFANGGSATTNHSILLSTDPIAAASFPQNFDFQAEADAQREPIPPLVEEWVGPATLETYTVLYDRVGAPRQGIIVARTADDRRTLAKVPAQDTETIAFLTDGIREPVGTTGRIVIGEDGLQVWLRD